MNAWTLDSGVKTKDSVNHGTADRRGSNSFWFSWPLSSIVETGRCAYTVFISQPRKTLSLGVLNILQGRYMQTCPTLALEWDTFIILDSKQICPLSWEETLYLPRMFAIQIFLEKQSVSLLTRCAEILETPEELSPNSVIIRYGF